MFEIKTQHIRKDPWYDNSVGNELAEAVSVRVEGFPFPFEKMYDEFIF